jgi:hypothetical protein
MPEEARDELGNNLSQLEQTIGQVGARLSHGWSIGRSLSTSIAANNGNLRSLGAITLIMGDALNEAIKEQRNLASVMTRTGRKRGFFSEKLVASLHMNGVSFSEAVQVFNATFTAGLNKSDRTTLKLMGEMQLLGVDVRKAAAMVAMNRHVLGLSVQESEKLIKTTVATAAQYHISTEAVISAITSLRETLKTTTVTYGPAVAKAMQQAMPHLLGMFGQESGAEISRVMSALLGGGPQQAQLAAKLGIPLEDLQGADTTREVISIVRRAVSQMDSLVAPLRGRAGSEFSVNAMIKAFGNVPELALLGRRVGQMTQTQKEEAMVQAYNSMVAQQQRETLVSFFNDFKTSVTTMILPIINAISFVLGGISDVIKAISGDTMTLGRTVGNILTIMILGKIWKGISANLEKVVLYLMARKGVAGAGILMRGGTYGNKALKGAKWGTGARITTAGFAKFGKAFGNVGSKLMGPWGIGIAVAATIIPSMIAKLTGKNDQMLDEQKKQTELMEKESSRQSSYMEDRISEAIALLSVLSETQIEGMRAQNPLLDQIAVATGESAIAQKLNSENFQQPVTRPSLSKSISDTEGGGGTELAQ